MSSFRRNVRTLAHAAVALLPSAIKVPVYRAVFGFRMGRGVRIGLSVLDVDHLEMEAGARIGHGNVMTRIKEVRLGEGAQIGFLNILRGGDTVDIGPYATVLRMNVLNSIPDAETEGPTDPRLTLGTGAYVVSGHRIDFTDRVRLGRNVLVAGRNSSLWTHNRQETRPIEIDDFCYLGSEVRIAPGARLGAESILGMGAVLTGAAEGGKLHGGVPARAIRELKEEERSRLHRKHRKDIPDGAV